MAKEPEKTTEKPGEVVKEVTVVYSESGAVRTLSAGQTIPPGFSKTPPAGMTAEDLSNIPPQHRHEGPGKPQT
jgi:hypothetical protein